MDEGDQRDNLAQDVLSVLEAAPVGMIKVDAAGTIVLTNRELERMFGYSREQLLGAALEVLIPERYRAIHGEHVRAFSSSPATRPMGAGQELYGRRRDGTEFPIDVALNYVRNGTERCVIASVIDVTEERRAKAELLRLNETLEQKNAELERFVFTVSHDLKAPIVTIMGYLGHLRRDVAREAYADLPEYATRIQAASERMRHKIDDLLRLSRIGRETASAQFTSVQDVVDAVVRDHEAELATRGVRVQPHVEAKRIWCDPQHLEQVVENLLANAIRYGTSDPTPRIEIWTREDSAGGVVLGVDDNGPGVEPRYAEKIFDLFQRLSPGGDGTGVGLAIVRRIANWYGGRAWVEPAPGKGGRFRMYFPPHTDAAPHASCPVRSQSGGSTCPHR